MKRIIKKLLSIQAIKVLLCAFESLIKRISCGLRKKIEQGIFNAYDFGSNNSSHAQKLSEKLMKLVAEHNYFLAGKSLLELGPGAFLGVGAYLKKEGVSEYFVLDNINHFEDLSQDAVDLYQSIDESMISNGKLNTSYVHVLSYENNQIQLPDETVDVVFSNAVYEHVSFPKESILDLGRITKPGGLGVHTIDYRDHIFGQEKLTIFTLPKRLYNGLFRDAGARTNRKKARDFRQYFETAGFEILEEITEIEYPEAVLQKHKNLCQQYGYENMKKAASTFVVKKRPHA